MKLSDVSVTRPVFAAVISLLLVAFGLVAFDRLPLREYPDIDPPVVTIHTEYPGAAAAVIDTRITELIEERLAGVEGVDFITSRSSDGDSRISVHFTADQDVDSAANDIRDRVSGIVDQLPDEADPPDIQKADSSDDVIMWLNLVSDRMTKLELTDYADRFLVDRFSTIDGVARIRVSGGLSYSMRIWLDRSAMAAHGLAVNDIEQVLRSQNVELPAGSIESSERQFTARVERGFSTPEEFQRMVVARGQGGHLVRLGDVAEVELAAVEERTFFRGNEVPMVGIGTIKQNQANTIAVADRVKAEAERLAPTLPDGMEIKQSYDTSVFVKEAVNEVYRTLAIAIGLVILIIYLFLGSVRATLVPAATVPVSLIATFIVLLVLGFSINLLTLLALVLAIGLVVDDTIVVLENIHRRVELGETPLVAAYKGAAQVGFAVIATTLVLISVFVPLAFLEGDLGKLFGEFAITMAAAVAFSSLVALTLSPMLASKVLTPESGTGRLTRAIDKTFGAFQNGYLKALRWCLRWPMVALVGFVALVGASGWLFSIIPSEYAPKEDRGVFFLLVNGPEGATHDYMTTYMDEIERRLMPYVESGEATRLLVRSPRGFGNLSSFNDGIVIMVLNDFDKRRNGFAIMDEVRADLSDLPGVRAFPVMRQAFGGGTQKPVQFVIGGGTYEELMKWRDTLMRDVAENNPKLINLDHNHKETRPELTVEIDKDRAGDLGVTVSNLGRTLETLFGARRVTTFQRDGEEYDVILEARRSAQRTPSDLSNLFIRSDSGQLVPLADLVTIQEQASPPSLNRFNRVRSITIEADLADGYTLGEGLAYMEEAADRLLPEKAQIDYAGQSRDFKTAGQSILFIFLLGLVVVYLTLAANFESFVHPFVIMLTVPLALAGGLFGLWLTGNTLNLYTQIGLVMLVGLAAKNGILIVEFINQLRDEGRTFDEAIVEASGIRLRPVVMTAITTVIGAVPLIMAFGAGAETRSAIGIVIFWGVAVASVFTVFVVPVVYRLIAGRTTSPNAVRRKLEKEMLEPRRTAGGETGADPQQPTPAPGE